MAIWTTIPDSSIEPGKPIRSIDGLALRDNPIAITEGASGAPRVLDAALSTTVTAAGTSWVLARNAGASVGAVGTYAFLLDNTLNATNAAGSTKAGSSLRYAGVGTDTDLIPLAIVNSGTPSGTWRCMGYSAKAPLASNGNGATLWLRIS